MEKCSDTILEVKDLKQYFNITTGFLKSKPLKAVDGVTFSIKRGETLGLVGESGCGKTTVGRTICTSIHLRAETSPLMGSISKPSSRCAKCAAGLRLCFRIPIQA